MAGGDGVPNIYFSDVFGVQPEVLEEYGAFNVALVNCWRRLNTDHLCRLNIDQGLLLT